MDCNSKLKTKNSKLTLGGWVEFLIPHSSFLILVAILPQ